MIRVPREQQQLPVMTHRRTSPFVLIRRAAELEGWGIAYLDYGIGHDSHVFTHRRRKQVVEVNYRASKPVSATLNGNPVEVYRVLDILTGVDSGMDRRRGA